ncbi:isochorismatase family protein [Roseateles sp.]|uniref:isochorismatase family protein n=1 Tax=Roseateles sp. TaxID=1971397 RepID=UPI002F40DF09
MIELSAKTTALVLVDLQRGILSLSLAPWTGQQVFDRGLQLASRLRAAGGQVVRVKVDFGDNGRLSPSGLVDQPSSSARPADFSQFPDEPLPAEDVVVTKRHWGSFHGTTLDLELRRRGIKTVVVGGIATNMGVESTVRSAHEHGYDVVVVSDATTAFSTAMNAFAFEHIFPRISRVAACDDLTFL